MGVLYSEGKGVKQNFHKAFKLYEKACGLDYMPACFNLGNFYKEGRGTKQDFASARKHFEKACNAKPRWCLQ